MTGNESVLACSSLCNRKQIDVNNVCVVIGLSCPEVDSAEPSKSH